MPAISIVHNDANLAEFSRQFGFGNSSFIAEMFSPRIGVKKQSDRYFTIDDEREILRQQETLRAPGTMANVMDWKLSTDTYNADDHALARNITDEEVANSDDPLVPVSDAIEALTINLGLDKEIRLAAQLGTDITTNNPTTPTNKWNQDLGDPISDIENMIAQVYDAVQHPGNSIVMDWLVWQALKHNPTIVERVKAGGTPNAPAVVTRNAVADILELDRDKFLVSTARKNTATRGATASMSTVWSDTIYVAWVPPRVGHKTVMPVATFAWEGDNGKALGKKVLRWRDDRIGADVVQVHDYYDMKTVAESAASKLENVLA